MTQTTQIELFPLVNISRGVFRGFLGDLLRDVNQGLFDDSERDYEFYPVKTRVLRKYGKFDGYDIQRIHDLCWSCDGTGRWHYWYDDGGDWCWKCNGTGTYRLAWHLLERWRLGEHVFHHPVWEVARLGRVAHFIKGRIESKHPDHIFAHRGLLVLLALFDLKGCRRVIKRRIRLRAHSHLNALMCSDPVIRLDNLLIDLNDWLKRLGLISDMTVYKD